MKIQVKINKDEIKIKEKLRIKENRIKQILQYSYQIKYGRYFILNKIIVMKNNF